MKRGEKAVFSQRTERKIATILTLSIDRLFGHSEQAADIFTPLLHSSYITEYQNTAKEVI